MAQQDYLPLAGNLILSVLAAAIPIVVLLYFLGIKRTSAEVAALFGLGAALIVALFCYHVPVPIAISAVGYGAAFGGVTALLGMLNSCSPNVTVVNIDNGFGAGYLATLIARR